MSLAASISIALLYFTSVKSLFLPQIDAPIYDMKLNSDLSFQWQIDYESEEILVEVSLVKHESGKTGTERTRTGPKPETDTIEV